MSKRKWPCDLFSGDGDFYETYGHHADEVFLAALLDHSWATCDPTQIERTYYRFIPIRGEPNEDTQSSLFSNYAYDEARNGYWFESLSGRGAVPVTRVERQHVHYLTFATPGHEEAQDADRTTGTDRT